MIVRGSVTSVQASALLHTWTAAVPHTASALVAAQEHSSKCAVQAAQHLQERHALVQCTVSSFLPNAQMILTALRPEVVSILPPHPRPGS